MTHENQTRMDPVRLHDANLSDEAKKRRGTHAGMVSQFRCGSCGKALQVGIDTYHYEAHPEPEHRSQFLGSGYSKICEFYVEPCKHCIESEVGPARNLANAINEVISGGKK